jgi:hypothetical protein
MVDMSQLKRPILSLRGHLAAISPHSNIFKQPPTPSSGHIHGAVYLFRHGNIEVSYHDYSHFIAPFLQKLHSLQSSGRPFVAGRLSFLTSFRSWITEVHVGMVSDEGFKRSLELGRVFRARYKKWLIPHPIDLNRCYTSGVTLRPAVSFLQWLSRTALRVGTSYQDTSFQCYTNARQEDCWSHYGTG